MSKYLISFDKGAMDHIPDRDLEQVGKDAHAVVQAAKDAGVYVFAGGLDYEKDDVEHGVVAIDGMLTDGPFTEGKEFIGGVTIVEVPTRDEALAWAAKIAVACRCPQDVRKFMYDPDV
ncbi:YciI family protein [Tenggerimyces flavus]|uniref:YciI family protein n=1 Tax=Tenggerimyces flavus TaxID=1708749 RepID=A0ABV7Y6Z0_9ACTN|nr:YciI family protein [Tenggerimyces flavus]MBM7784986.1 hypothetical protein [Tenggerimyces flavus]